jgi:hypothetical protein
MLVSALSVVVPSGTHIARGIKTLEVRRWRPAVLPVEGLVIVENGRYLREEGEVDPSGMAVAVVSVREVREWRAEDVAAACAERYEPGWLAWVLEDVRPIAVPFRAVAARGIYELELDERQLKDT